MRAIASWCAHSRRWQARLDGVSAVPLAAPRPSGFVAARVAPIAALASVRVELNAGGARFDLHWPLAHTRELAALLRELVRVHGVHRRRLTQLQTDGDGCAPRGRGRPSAGRHGGQRPSKQARRRGVGDGREHGGMHELPQVHALAQAGLMNAEATSHKVVAAQ